MGAGRTGLIRFNTKAQYDDFVSEIQKDASLVRKCIGLQTGLMVLFNDIADEKYKEVIGLAAGGTWYDDFQLSLASKE